MQGKLGVSQVAQTWARVVRCLILLGTAASGGELLVLVMMELAIGGLVCDDRGKVALLLLSNRQSVRLVQHVNRLNGFLG